MVDYLLSYMNLLCKRDLCRFIQLVAKNKQRLLSKQPSSNGTLLFLVTINIILPQTKSNKGETGTHRAMTIKNGAVNQLFTDFKKAYDSVRREVLYNTVTEFGIPMKPLRLTKMCLNGTYTRVQVGKYMSDMFLLRMV
jgi:hypothetical protein